MRPTDHSTSNHTPHLPQNPSGIWRYPRVHQETGLSRTTIWRKVKDGTFPAPVKVTSHNIGWLASEVAAWQANLPRAVLV